jgi:hypothetical protein
MAQRIFFFAGRFVIAVTTIGGIVLIAWAWDLHNDRQHTVTVISKTPIFVQRSGEVEACFDGQHLIDVPQSVHLEVRRIRYWKNCATLKVALSDGREGYVVYGVGGFSVSPPI